MQSKEAWYGAHASQSIISFLCDDFSSKPNKIPEQVIVSFFEATINEGISSGCSSPRSSENQTFSS